MTKRVCKFNNGEMDTSIANDIKKLQIENKRLESIIDVQMNTVTDCRNRERRINALLAKLPYPT